MRADRVTSRTVLQTAYLLALPIIIGRAASPETPALLYLPVAAVLMIYLLSEIMWERSVFRAVRLLMRDERGQEADVCRHRLGVFGFFTGIVLGIVVFFLQPFLFGAEAAIGRSWVSLFILPGLAFLGAAGAERGFLRARGAALELSIIYILQNVLFFLLPVLGGVLAGRHGSKVDALLMTDCYRYVYAGAGTMTGISLAAFLIWLLLLLMRLRYRVVSLFATGRGRRHRDQAYFSAEGLPVPALFILCAVDLFLWFHAAHPEMGEETPSLIFQFGRYAGSVLAPTVFLGVFLSVPFVRSIYQIIAGFQHDDEASALDRFATMVRHAMILELPAAFVCFALSVPLTVILCGKQDAFTLPILRFNVLMVPVLGFALLLCVLFIKFGGVRAVAISAVCGIAVHILTVFLMLAAGRGLYAFVLGHFLGFLVFAVMTFIFLSLSLTYRQEWMHGFIIPLLSAVLSALPAFFLSSLLCGVIGEILTTVLLAALSGLLYIIILTALHGVTEYELYHVPGGGLFVGFSRLFGRGA